jgi:ribosomal protein S18 acetylase RimI-like enzyme
MVGHDEAGRLTPAGSREPTGEAVSVHGLPGERLEGAADLLARCFHANPNFVDLFADEGDRYRALPRMFAAGLRDALDFGHVYAATWGVGGSSGDELVGVAVWLPPGTYPLSVARQLRALPGMTSVLAAAPRSARRLLRYTGAIARLHPAQPYWYLEVVGVDPAARGLGVGTRLLEPVLGLADRADQSCYLETMTERNVAWYRRLGFEVRDAGVSFVPGGPPNWTMMRPPRFQRAAEGRRDPANGPPTVNLPDEEENVT